MYAFLLKFRAQDGAATTRPSERFPAIAYPKSLGAHNLPVRLTGFVGRASELTQVGELLAENQLVTLTGAGGAAKPGWRCFNTYTAGNGRDGDSGKDWSHPSGSPSNNRPAASIRSHPAIDKWGAGTVGTPPIQQFTDGCATGWPPRSAG
jgi:hypothetical protein